MILQTLGHFEKSVFLSYHIIIYDLNENNHILKLLIICYFIIFVIGCIMYHVSSHLSRMSCRVRSCWCWWRSPVAVDVSNIIIIIRCLFAVIGCDAMRCDVKWFIDSNGMEWVRGIEYVDDYVMIMVGWAYGRACVHFIIMISYVIPISAGHSCFWLHVILSEWYPTHFTSSLVVGHLIWLLFVIIIFKLLTLFLFSFHYMLLWIVTAPLESQAATC